MADLVSGGRVLGPKGAFFGAFLGAFPSFQGPYLLNQWKWGVENTTVELEIFHRLCGVNLSSICRSVREFLRLRTNIYIYIQTFSFIV